MRPAPNWSLNCRRWSANSASPFGGATGGAKLATVTVHLIKLAVGIDSVEHLRAVQRQRLRESVTRGERARLRHVTRSTPRRAAEIVDGGSMYWVIRGTVRARQRIVAIEPVAGRDGIGRCALILGRKLIPTLPFRKRAFQGWRYLNEADAPPDARNDAHTLPPKLAAELRELGLL